MAKKRVVVTGAAGYVAREYARSRPGTTPRQALEEIANDGLYLLKLFRPSGIEGREIAHAIACRVQGDQMTLIEPNGCVWGGRRDRRCQRRLRPRLLEMR